MQEFGACVVTLSTQRSTAIIFSALYLDRLLSNLMLRNQESWVQILPGAPRFKDLSRSIQVLSAFSA